MAPELLATDKLRCLPLLAVLLLLFLLLSLLFVNQESLGVIMATVGAALAADLPPGCKRTLYLCDDGKDPDKKQYIHRLGPQAV